MFYLLKPGVSQIGIHNIDYIYEIRSLQQFKMQRGQHHPLLCLFFSPARLGSTSGARPSSGRPTGLWHVACGSRQPVQSTGGCLGGGDESMKLSLSSSPLPTLSRPPLSASLRRRRRPRCGRPAHVRAAGGRRRRLLGR